ncbi:phage shock envelope stress response protein PspM [Fodinicola acaciae]|uniref:phage shock envelope stress response protein PspM n=1 Tax=Fodinicola acaciae TaxID=2681555 RepID=UPI0013D1C428|nr:hypothetical protein [Fodinicola acaciae]
MTLPAPREPGTVRPRFGDPRERHLRAVRRAGRRARRWIVTASMAAGVAAVAVPLGGLSWVDAIWTGIFGGSAAIAVFRVRDHRALLAMPVPDPLPPAPEHQAVAVVKQAAGGAVLRWNDRRAVRGTPGAELLRRIERASAALPPMLTRVRGAVHGAIDPGHEAVQAEAALRDAVRRYASVHRTTLIAPPDAAPAVRAAAGALHARIGKGIAAYEQLVVAAAECVAADGYADRIMIDRISEATDALRAMAHSLGELDGMLAPYGPEVARRPGLTG